MTLIYTVKCLTLLLFDFTEVNSGKKYLVKVKIRYFFIIFGFKIII